RGGDGRRRERRSPGGRGVDRVAPPLGGGIRRSLLRRGAVHPQRPGAARAGPPVPAAPVPVDAVRPLRPPPAVGADRGRLEPLPPTGSTPPGRWSRGPWTPSRYSRGWPSVWDSWW